MCPIRKQRRSYKKDEWNKIALPVDVGEKFVLGYFIGDVVGMRKYSQILAKHFNGKVVVINQNLRDLCFCGKCVQYSAGPREFIWLIKNSSIVCTNSFHAVAFSLIFNKNFFVFIDGNARNEDKPQQRIYNITELVGLESQIIDQTICGKIDMDQQINWKNVNDKLHFAIEESKNYINDCLQ